MENNHEKTILIGSSYFMGFLTAFIFYGSVFYSNIPVKAEVLQDKSNVVVTTPEIERVDTNAPDSDFYVYTNGSLNVFNKNGMRTLTASASSTNATSSTEGLQGVHYSAPLAVLSPDKKFLYFCEQQTEEADYCVGYVYSFETDTINLISVDRAPFIPTIELAKEVEWTETGLNLAEMNSKNANTPWILSE